MTKKDRTFVETVRNYYHTNGRHTLPWRHVVHPYPILVSELMLQQTQVARVIPKYKEFLKRFPTTKALATTSLADVLALWQGLGYNRRAKYLKEAATIVHTEYRGRWPTTATALVELPGVGVYTAGAVAAFAYNEAVPIIETNITTVYLHHYFSGATDVPKAAIMEKVRTTLVADNPREWYYALMDYGAHLKLTLGNQNSRQRGYTVQAKFAGSDRQLRGAVIRALITGASSFVTLRTSVIEDTARLRQILRGLIAEGLIVRTKDDCYALPD